MKHPRALLALALASGLLASPGTVLGVDETADEPPLDAYLSCDSLVWHDSASVQVTTPDGAVLDIALAGDEPIDLAALGPDEPALGTFVLLWDDGASETITVDPSACDEMGLELGAEPLCAVVPGDPYAAEIEVRGVSEPAFRVAYYGDPGAGLGAPIELAPGDYEFAYPDGVVEEIGVPDCAASDQPAPPSCEIAVRPSDGQVLISGIDSDLEATLLPDEIEGEWVVVEPGAYRIGYPDGTIEQVSCAAESPATEPALDPEPPAEGLGEEGPAFDPSINVCFRPGIEEWVASRMRSAICL